LAEGFADPTAFWEKESPNAPPELGWWHYFEYAMNRGLEPFVARVETMIDMLVRVVDEDEAPSQPLRVGLYSAACAQVFNLVVLGHTARFCANETCGRSFFHQLGGSFHRHRDEGLRYCTPACARAQAAREYRRRKAKGKEQP
jgi:hypothetical protein